MKKYSFLLLAFLLSACEKQTQFSVPDCVQRTIDISHRVDELYPPRITQYEYNCSDYYVIVRGTLDGGSVGVLRNNQCETICTFTDDLTCSGSADFWQKAKVLKVLLE